MLGRFVVRALALEDALKRALRASQNLLPLEGGGREVGVRQSLHPPLHPLPSREGRQQGEQFLPPPPGRGRTGSRGDMGDFTLPEVSDFREG